MKHAIPVCLLAGLSLTVMASAPASAGARQQRAPANYTAMNATKPAPAVPVQPAAARTYLDEDGTDIAIRLQDAHHGDGTL